MNFDKGLAQTMAEAKALARMRVPLPEAARVVLLQEEKFQVYYDTLTHALQVGCPIAHSSMDHTFWCPHQKHLRCGSSCVQASLAGP